MKKACTKAKQNNKSPQTTITKTIESVKVKFGPETQLFTIKEYFSLLLSMFSSSLLLSFSPFLLSTSPFFSHSFPSIFFLSFFFGKTIVTMYLHGSKTIIIFQAGI